MNTAPPILVTGAAGFIGSHTVERLVTRGDHVVGVDNFDPFYDVAIKQNNVETVAQLADGRFDFQTLDICDADAVDRLFEQHRPRAVIHLAALAGVRPSIERPADYARVNCVGTTHLLEAAVKYGVDRFVFASSSSVYGNNTVVPFSESHEVAHPISPYAASKRAGELVCHAFSHLHDLPVACLRFFTVYGPRQRPDLAIRKFVRLIEAGEPVPVFGDGSSSRDYTFVADTVSGIVAALDRVDRFRIYNLGNSHPVTLNELLEAIQEAVGKRATLNRLPVQPGDVARTYADISRARDELGYDPKTPLVDGLRAFVQWRRQQTG